jgi:predicted SAM-dependent methyltransferase/ADP-heptose:LPS heptosyltransferase
MVWTLETSNGFESDKIKYDIVPYTRGRGLDLGCGHKKVWPHAIGVDNGHHFGQAGADVIVETCEDLGLFADGSMDFVFSSHLLEHIEDYEAALKEWWRVIKIGGYLVLYLPHKDFYPNIGQPGANPDHKHDFVPADIMDCMRYVDPYWELVQCQERNEGNEYSFLMVIKKRDADDAPTGITLTARKDGRMADGKTACVVRYGGFGDMVQMSSILPGLKREGYHVTVMTTPMGQSPLIADPHIDAWIIQDNNQVPNPELHAYWEVWRKKFDRWINLSEATEASAIAYPGRSPYYWTDRARRAYFGRVNYLELIHEIAGIDDAPNIVFYPTPEEKKWAEDQYRQFGTRPVIVWSLSGSSFHKAYPWTDAVVARLMLETDAVVVFVGDIACKILEQGWENEKRVLCTSGEWSIRQTLAFAQHAEVVVGPETGVVNSVGFNPRVHKVLLLSHSSEYNLCKDWLNYTALEPKGAPCYPCHKMHLTRDSCVEDEETGAALCAARISPDDVFAAILATPK